MVRTPILASALASCLASPASAGSFDDALRLVPQDAVAAFVVPSVKTASDDLQLAIDAMGKAEAALGGRPVDLLKAQLGLGAGFDDRGAFVLWAAESGKGFAMGGAFPVVDADAFVKASFVDAPEGGEGAVRMPGQDGTFFLRKAGSHVVVCADAAALVAWKPADGFRGALERRVGRRAMEIARTGDLFAWASGPVMKELSLRVRAAADADAAIAQAIGAGGGGGALGERLAEAASHRARSGEVLDQLDDAMLAADFDALAIGVRAWARFADGSEVAKAIPAAAAQPRDTAALLARLPAAVPYAAMGIDLAGMGGLAHLRRFLGSMPEGDRLVLPPWVDRVQDKVRCIQVAAYPSKLGVMVGGLFNDASLVVATDDPAAVRDSLKAWIAEQAGERGGVRTEVTWEDARQLKDGSTAAAFAVKEVRREQGAADLQEMLVRQLVLGARGLHGFAREVPGGLVVTFSQRADVLDRATKAATGGAGLGGGPVVRAMLPWLVPDADMVAFVGVGELVSVGRQVAMALPGAGPEALPEAPEGLEPVGFAFRSKSREWEAAVVLPSRVLGLGFDAAMAAAGAGELVGDEDARGAGGPVDGGVPAP